MDLKRHSNLFNRIAFAYRWFFRGQVKKYKRIINTHRGLFDKSDSEEPGRIFDSSGSTEPNRFLDTRTNHPPPTILDIGCGTGAFSRAFELLGFSVRGIDIAHNMVEAARDRSVDCMVGDVTKGLQFDNESFDFVVSAYVAHGLDYPLRQRLFTEAKRIARKKVIIHDYSRRRSLGSDFIEWLEGGGYFNFIEEGYAQMVEVFGAVEVIPVSKHANWYVCAVT